ncbi:MAG: signal peptide peptidase SppA [Candidatus Cryosericum sp.]
MLRNEMLFKTVQNRVWALHPAKLEEMYLFFDRILGGEKIEFPQSAAGKSGNRAEEAYEVREGVAILPVYGIIDKRMNIFMNYSGGTSTELLARDFRQAIADPQVEAILLDIDSPGGSVDGTKELADLILAAREQKPVVAYANGLMASAAYWVGSGAQMILAPETAEVGSIGVALMHYDYSAADQMEGVKRTVITGGKFKRIASDEKPLSKEGQEYLQGMVDDYYALFLEAAAAARGLDVKTVHEKMADGRIFVGKKALKAGLIDQIGYLNDALALARAKGGAMPKNMTKATLQAENPELFQALLAEGAASVKVQDLLAKDPEIAEKLRAEGREAGIKAERTRVMEILGMNSDAKISLEAIRAGTTALETAPLLLKAEQEGRAKSLETLRQAAPPVVGQDVKVETFTEEKDSLPIEKQAMKEWDGPDGPKLKAEFSLFSTYLAFRQAQTQGQLQR